MGTPVPAAAPAPAATTPRGSGLHEEELRLRAPGRTRLRAIDWWRVAPAILAALVSVAYLIAAPRTVDLAASVYRARLFDHVGFTIWDGQWYGGHYTLGYSLLFPPLAWVLGPLVVGALSAVASAALFEPLARAHFGERARLGALWFGLAATTPLISGRIPFGLGVALALGALLAIQRRRTAVAVALAVACSLASPVAGAFLALCALAHAIGGRSRVALALAAAALTPPVLLALTFPAGGREPFAKTAFLPIPLAALAFVVLLPRRERTLRTGAVLYAAAGTAALFVHTPMGGNAVRLGALVAGPVMACALLGGDRDQRRRPPTALVALTLLGLAFWQWSPAVRDVKKAYEDESTRASYYRPLLDYLEKADSRRARIEIPFTRSHWEAAEVAPHFPLARGWERQADIGLNGLFYDGVLNPFTYATWLTEHGVSFVALPDVKPDYSAYRERALIETGLPYLHLRWRSRHWRVYEVTLPHPMVIPRGGADISLARAGVDYVKLRVASPGQATVRVQWSPYWRLRGGCVERDGDWTRVVARRPGALHLTMEFTPARVFSHGRRCG
ncbi:MAG TPA: hypothetical protein VF545_08415 [Thermoleophilaceae bacterium]|jgi:hypothetical protein